jgi:hypothetical protein
VVIPSIFIVESQVREKAVRVLRQKLKRPPEEEGS